MFCEYRTALYTKTTECVSECPMGFLFDNANHVCIPSNCTDIKREGNTFSNSNNYKCNKCNIGFREIFNKCVCEQDKIQDSIKGTCVLSNCGEILSKGNTLLNEGEFKCSYCNDNYSLFEGYCYPSCKEGQIYNPKTKSCDNSNCLNIQSEGNSLHNYKNFECLECEDKFALFKGLCTKICPIN